MSNHPNRSTERVTITNLHGEAERVTLPHPHYHRVSSGRREDETGVWIEAIYSGPRTGRKFVRTYSIWDAGNGRTVGTTYREMDESEYLRLCERVGTEPVNVEETEA